MSEFVLNQGYGYGIVLGLGALFSVLMIALSWAIAKFLNQKQDSERFTTASRNVKQGLISSAVVSSWTWPATLLTSNLWTYSYGIVGAYWYSVTGCFQILVFTLVAIEIKLKCPGIHTIAEVAKVRFGKWGHFCYLFYSLGTNVIVSGMILLGGSFAQHARTLARNVAGPRPAAKDKAEKVELPTTFDENRFRRSVAKLQSRGGGSAGGDGNAGLAQRSSALTYPELPQLNLPSYASF